MKIPAFTALPRFSLARKTVSLRDAEPNRPLRKSLAIISNYDEQFQIRSTSSQNATIRVLSRQMADNRCKLELEILPPPHRGKRFFRDVLYVNLADSDQLRIDLRGFYKENKTES